MAVPALACARGGHAMRTTSAAIWPAWHWVLAPGAERDGPAVVLAKTESAANCVLLTAAELSASAGATGIGAIARNGATRAARGTFRHWPFLGVVSIVSQAHLASASLHAMPFRLLAVTLGASEGVGRQCEWTVDCPEPQDCYSHYQLEARSPPCRSRHASSAPAIWRCPSHVWAP